MLVRYVGEEPETTAYGVTFPHGEPVEVEGVAAEKLAKNPVFEVVEEAPKRGRKAKAEEPAAEEAGEL